MGFGQCRACGNHRDNISYPYFEARDDSDDRSCLIIREIDKCTKCGNSFCGRHGIVGVKYKCCGLTLCGFQENEDAADEGSSYMVDEQGFGCAFLHRERLWKCGHIGCNFTKKCNVCKIKEDQTMVRELMKNKKCKSKSLKNNLSKWLKESDELEHENEKAVKKIVQRKLHSVCEL